MSVSVDFDCGSPGFSRNSSSIDVACNSKLNLACSTETTPAGKPILLYAKAACHIATATKHVLLEQNRLDVGPQLQTINPTAMSICWPEVMKSSLELESVVRPGRTAAHIMMGLHAKGHPLNDIQCDH